MGIQSPLEDERLTEIIGRLLRDNYDLGKLVSIEEISGGYCNKSYEIRMVADKKYSRYFLRLYNPNTAEHEILFEHDLLSHLRANGFTLAAAIIPCRNGQTMLDTQPPDSHQGKRAIWTLFEFLEGEEKYSWASNSLTDNEFINAAGGLAHLHHCGHGFTKSPGTDRNQPRIMDYIATFKNTFYRLLETNEHSRCDRLFADNFKIICDNIDYGVSFKARFKGMKVVTIHCDYHPGNLKYCDEKGVEVFDFDWSKIDYRLFDVALALVYFTSIWDDKTAGLRRDKFTLFLSAYNEACRRLTHIYPLTKQEQNGLVPMLSLANLYVLHWGFVDFHETDDKDDEEYYSYLNHGIGLMHWIVHNKDELELWGKQS